LNTSSLPRYPDPGHSGATASGGLATPDEWQTIPRAVILLLIINIIALYVPSLFWQGQRAF
jgi:hypothetical protein